MAMLHKYMYFFSVSGFLFYIVNQRKVSRFEYIVVNMPSYYFDGLVQERHNSTGVTAFLR